MTEQTRYKLLIIAMAISFSLLLAIQVLGKEPRIGGNLVGKIVRPPLPLGVNKPMTIPERIYAMCTAQGLSDYEANRMVRVAKCESNFIPTAQNKYSSAAGLFEIIYSTWLANSQYSWSDRYDAVKNIDTAIRLFKRSGFSPWVCKGY